MLLLRGGNIRNVLLLCAAVAAAEYTHAPDAKRMRHAAIAPNVNRINHTQACRMIATACFVLHTQFARRGINKDLTRVPAADVVVVVVVAAV